MRTEEGNAPPSSRITSVQSPPRNWWARFSSDLPTKLGALIVASLLWYAATSERRATVTRTLELPLVVQGLSAERAVSDLPTSVKASVRGPRVTLENLEPRDLEASVDVSTAADGYFSADVRLTVPEGLSKIALQPSRVSGTLELLVRRSVSVRLASLEARLPGSLDLTPLRFAPRNVTVLGRRAQVKQVMYALAIATQLPERGGSLDIKLTPVDERGEPVDGVSLEPSETKLTL
jgi:YbbR domain-containing protein